MVLTVNKFGKEENRFEFSNKQAAIDSFIERCNELDYEYEIDSNGDYSTTTRGDYYILLMF